MKTPFLFCLFFLLSVAVIAQQPAVKHPCAANPLYRQFDFWLGQWEAFGTNGKKAGDSNISLLLDSCIIFEEWTSTQAGYAGKSYNTYNPVTGKWQQYWVDNKGGITEYFNGRFENDTMVLQTANNRQPDGTFKIMKMTFSHAGTGIVRQLGQSSGDEGKTWETDFDLEYRRKK